MEIRRRIGLPRMSFHVMNRGARRAVIFKDDQDRRSFVDLLGTFCVEQGIRLTSWSLMTNHYHLEPDSEGTPLSATMHNLDGTYAKAYNRRHESSGCLFQGRFKSMSIDDERGLAFVSRYIHLNPRDLGVDPLTYAWSSCRAYLGLDPVPPWLDPMPVLRQFGDTLEEARINYKRYLSAAAPSRRKTRGGDEPVEDFLVDYIAHLEELCREWIAESGLDDETLPLNTFVCWYACRLEKVPYRCAQEYYGYASPETVRALVCRFDRRIAQEPALADWLAKVNVYAGRKR
jgi:REP element-mobilizing transposase RayT